jgi:hypothetical protein
MNALLLRTTQLTLVCLILLLTGSTRPVLAHGAGRTLQSAHVAVGDYFLTIWTAPTMLRPGEIHVEAMLLDGSGQPAQGGLIHVALTPLERQDPPLSALAYPTAAGQLGLWQAALQVAEPGVYRVEVTVLDEIKTGGAVTFDVTIQRIPRAIQGGIYLLLLGSGLAGGWLLKQGLRVWSYKRRSTDAQCETSDSSP